MIALYIDPGTGSMLFSVVIGVVATLYFSFRTIWIKSKGILLGKGSVSMANEKLVIYNEGKQYMNLFTPVVNELIKRKVPFTYLTSYDKDPFLDKKADGFKSEFIGEGNKAFAKLNLIKADNVLMTTPGLDVYQMKRSKGVKRYIHLVHMPSDTATYRVFGLDYFDAVLLSGEYQKRDIRYLEKLRGLKEKELVTVGCPYIDILKEKSEKDERKEHQFTVLVSPSWGPSSLLSRFGTELLDPLEESNFNVILRPHPQSLRVETDLIESLKQRYKDSKNIVFDTSPDNYNSLSTADIMISDFSGIIFDYTLVFDKPVIYLSQGFDNRIYDAYDIPYQLWQFESLKSFGIELRKEDLKNIESIIKNAADSEELSKARAKARTECWANQGESAIKIADYLEEHMKESK